MEIVQCAYPRARSVPPSQKTHNTHNTQLAISTAQQSYSSPQREIFPLSEKGFYKSIQNAYSTPGRSQPGFGSGLSGPPSAPSLAGGRDRAEKLIPQERPGKGEAPLWMRPRPPPRPWCHPTFGRVFSHTEKFADLLAARANQGPAASFAASVLVTGRKDDGSDGVGPRGGKGGRVYADSGRIGREGGEAQGHPDRSPERLSLLRGWGPQVYVAGRGEDRGKGARAPAQASAVSRGVQRIEVGLRPVQEPHDDGLFLPVRLRR